LIQNKKRKRILIDPRKDKNLHGTMAGFLNGSMVFNHFGGTGAGVELLLCQAVGSWLKGWCFEAAFEWGLDE
jgi:hypothetical protein